MAGRSLGHFFWLGGLPSFPIRAGKNTSMLILEHLLFQKLFFCLVVEKAERQPDWYRHIVNTIIFSLQEYCSIQPNINMYVCIHIVCIYNIPHLLSYSLSMLLLEWLYDHVFFISTTCSYRYVQKHTHHRHTYIHTNH